MNVSRAELGDLVEIKGGGTPSKANPSFWAGDIPWVSPKDMKRWEIDDAEDKITSDAINNSATNLIPSNSILVVNRSGILKHTLPVGITRRPVAINQDIKALICNGRAHPEYIAHMVKAAEPIVLKWVRATTADNFSIENLRSLQIPLPPLDKQRRIAAILDKADALRRRRKRAAELIDSLCLEQANLAFDEIESVALIGDICDVQGGLQLSSAREALPTKLPYLRVANVYRNQLDLSVIKTMGVTRAEQDRTALVKGDILFVEGHGNADEIGRCAVWDGSIDSCVHQNHLIRARPNTSALDTLTLSYWLNSIKGRRHLLKRGKTTSGLNTISVSDVRSTVVPLLPREAQKRLRVQLGKIDLLKQAYVRQSCGVDALFSSLQSRAFSGQL